MDYPMVERSAKVNKGIGLKVVAAQLHFRSANCWEKIETASKDIVVVVSRNLDFRNAVWEQVF